MKFQSANKIKKGFTLIELLVAMAILAILATVGLVSFRMAQVRGRDVERKSDLKQISNALELYYSDYKVYPPSIPSGGEFTDTKTTYLMEVPQDPSGVDYVYLVSPSGNKFQLFSYLENPEDKNISEDAVDRGISCGEAAVCNFSITSANTTAAEVW